MTKDSVKTKRQGNHSQGKSGEKGGAPGCDQANAKTMPGGDPPISTTKRGGKGNKDVRTKKERAKRGRTQMVTWGRVEVEIQKDEKGETTYGGLLKTRQRGVLSEKKKRISPDHKAKSGCAKGGVHKKKGKA